MNKSASDSFIDHPTHENLTLIENTIDKELKEYSINKSTATALHKAASEGNVELTRHLIQSLKNRCNAATYHSGTPIQLISFYINKKNEVGDTALHEAVRSNSMSIIQELIGNGAHIAARNGKFCTPLHIACYYGYVQAAQILINTHSHKLLYINMRDNAGNTALHYAVHNNHIQCAYALVTQGALLKAQNKSGETAYDIALSRKHATIIGFLQYQADPYRFFNIHKTQLISSELSYNKPTICHLLIWASLLGHDNFVEKMLDFVKQEALKKAIKCNLARKKVLTTYISALINARDDYKTCALLYAAKYGKYRIVKKLLHIPLTYHSAFMTNPNRLDNTYRTPLSYAAQNNDFYSVETLLEHGALVDIPDITGKTALIYAIESGDWKMQIKILAFRYANKILFS